MAEYLVHAQAADDGVSGVVPLIHYELVARGARHVVCSTPDDQSVVAAFRWAADDAAMAQREAAEIVREALSAVTGSRDTAVEAQPVSLLG